MDIVCPDCAAVYEIDDASVTESGRKVRCAACSTVWRVFPARFDPETGTYLTPSPATPLPEQAARQETDAVQGQDAVSQDTASADSPEPVVATVEAPAESPDTIPQSPRAKWQRNTPSGKQGHTLKSRILSWPTGAIAATLLIVAGGLHQRVQVVKYLPQTAGLYAAIGLPVNLRGVTISNIGSRLIDDNGVVVLVIDGDLLNATDQNVRLPRLRFAVLGKDRQEIYAWSAQADQASLKPGEKINFRRRLAAPPTDGQDVSVRFVTASDITSGFK